MPHRPGQGGDPVGPVDQPEDAGGIDPAVRGADPEFSGKNAVAISEVTDGYWIF